MNKDLTPDPNGNACLHMAASGSSFSMEGEKQYRHAERRVVTLLAIVALQIVILKLGVNPWDTANGGRYVVLSTLVQPTTYFIVAFLLLVFTDMAGIWRNMIRQSMHYGWRKRVMPQFISYFALILCVSQLLPTSFFPYFRGAPGMEPVWVTALSVSVLATCALSLLMIARKEFWIAFAKSQKIPLLLAFAFSAGAYVIGSLVQRSWHVLGAPTMHLSKMFLGMMYEDIKVDYAQAVLGTSDFAVTIDAPCSGYEGLGIMLVFLTWYIFSFRKDLRFPNILLVIPLGMAMIWIFNALRIALLIAVGSEYSQDVAINGFHSSAGWISFIGVSLSIFWFTQRSPHFSKTATASRPSLRIDSGNAPVIPMLVLLASTLITILGSGTFPWLYPVRVVAVGATLWLLWPHFRFTNLRPRMLPVLAGVAVFIAWIALVPASAEKNSEFAEHLFSAPETLVAFWLIARLIGSVLIVPIAEELAFRRYIFEFFKSTGSAQTGGGSIQWVPMALSSLLFGGLHSAWLAGTLAGLVYYLVMRRSGKLWDAIVAHMTTNGLLSAYVLVSGNWSYW